MPARLLRESWNFSRRSAESEIATGKLSTLTAMANSTSPSDEQLLHLMMNGDEEAFVVLYQRRQGGVYRFALHPLERDRILAHGSTTRPHMNSGGVLTDVSPQNP